ncbi:MAG TPA: LysR substrate-binding domain-containing protein [Burkholderiaceae bacterium]|nr:LysR substrate-binding domain-containing protein [Burkholderiaceae bacterium]
MVRIATAAAVGAAWLLPALKQRSSHPGAARVDLSTVATADELPPHRWDILVHYGRHPRRGSQHRQLFADRLVAVCAAAARRRSSAPILRLSQLDVTERDLGLTTHRRAGGQLVFDDALAMLEAAAAGVGVAIATETAAQPYLASGRLVRATEVVLTGQKYFADLSVAGRRKPAASRPFDWLVRHGRGEPPSRAVAVPIR